MIALTIVHTKTYSDDGLSDHTCSSISLTCSDTCPLVNTANSTDSDRTPSDPSSPCLPTFVCLRIFKVSATSLLLLHKLYQTISKQGRIFNRHICNFFPTSPDPENQSRRPLQSVLNRQAAWNVKTHPPWEFRENIVKMSSAELAQIVEVNIGDSFGISAYYHIYIM